MRHYSAHTSSCVCCLQDKVCKWQNATTGKPEGIDMCCTTICVKPDATNIKGKICCPRSRVYLKPGSKLVGCCPLGTVWIPVLLKCIDPDLASTGTACPPPLISCLFKNGTKTCCPSSKLLPMFCFI